MASIDDKPNATSTPETITAPTPAQKVIFPYVDSIQRLLGYSYYEQLFMGDHFEAFSQQIQSDQYNKAYAKLRYTAVNFAGMITKIVADMLFSEPVTLKMPKDGDQEFAEAVWRENSLDVQCYESALSNSYNGDSVFKVRVGKRHPNQAKSTIIIEDLSPRIYFPHNDPFNVRAMPLQQELAWIFYRNNEQFVRREIHEPGKIINKVNKLENGGIGTEVGLDILGVNGLLPEVQTKIEQSCIVHIPNWKVGARWSGISDYYDLDSIFYAINNRMTKIDNVLDKHTDPILMVPPGVLDEDGKVKKKALGVIEIGEGEQGKPEYIVWDASLENAFKQIEKLVEFMYMIGEVSPDVLGMGQGMADSGRALKFKLMRTIAKVARKKLYYYIGLQQVMYVAQLMAEAWGVEVDGLKLTKKPVKPDLTFADGMPIDDRELLENEQIAIDTGITSKKDSMMRVYGIDEKTADERLKQIEDEKPKIALPESTIGNDLMKNKGGKPGAKPSPNNPAPPAK